MSMILCKIARGQQVVLVALCACYFVMVVHSSFVGIVVKDDSWFSVLPSADLCSLM